DSTLKCGNGYISSLYGRTSGSSALPAPSGWTQLGCYMDQSSRTLSLASTTDSAAMTVEKCMAFCPTTAKYIGLESKTECYCGSTLNVDQKLAATDCLSSCVGDPSEICGGSWRLTLFQRNGATSSSSSSSSSSSTTTTSSSSSTSSASSTSSTTSTTTTTTSSSASATSSSGPAPAGWTNLGCYMDQTPRTLSGATKTGWTGMTPTLCGTFCAGYTYFGTEYGNECYCGNSLVTNTPKPSSDCNVNCNGDANLKKLEFEFRGVFDVIVIFDFVNLLDFLVVLDLVNLFNLVNLFDFLVVVDFLVVFDFVKLFGLFYRNVVVRIFHHNVVFCVRNLLELFIRKLFRILHVLNLIHLDQPILDLGLIHHDLQRLGDPNSMEQPRLLRRPNHHPNAQRRFQDGQQHDSSHVSNLLRRVGLHLRGSGEQGGMLLRQHPDHQLPETQHGLPSSLRRGRHADLRRFIEFADDLVQ
ncbi:hypothetical protein FRC01_009398, partial [Tulasnella sp. 417]